MELCLLHSRSYTEAVELWLPEGTVSLVLNALDGSGMVRELVFDRKEGNNFVER